MKDKKLPVAYIAFEVLNLLKRLRICRIFAERKGFDMKIKIYLDDRRPLPESKGRCVRTYEDCIYALKIFKEVEFISLDYDLGTPKGGYDVLVFMLENGNKVEHINIHSDHSIGVPRMREFIRENFPNSRLTFNPL